MEKSNSTNGRRKRRAFGSVRRTSAGRYQARYTGSDGTARKGPSTFATKREADIFLARIQTQLHDGEWTDPKATAPTLAEFIPRFQSARVGRGGGAIKPRTLQLSEHQLTTYILPVLGHLRLDEITPRQVNDWWLELPDRPSLNRQLYSLLKAAMNFAARDGYIRGTNPCQIRGAGQNHYDERPHMSLEQVDRVIGAMTGDLQVLASLGFNAHLRLGEVLALRVSDVNLGARQLTVRRGVTEVANQQLETGTKTRRARTIDLDDETRDMLRRFFDTNARDPEDRIFRRSDGSPLRHHHVQGAWKRARLAVGLEIYRFHDLRHAGLTMLAEAGLPGFSLMHRAGHTTMTAVVNYQHRSGQQGRVEASRFEDHKRKQRAIVARQNSH